MEYDSMTPMQKAAVALVAFGPEVSALVLKGMAETDLEAITIEIANLRDVPNEVEEKVIDECHQIFMARQYISQGGVDFARQILEKAVGSGKASEIMHRLETTIPDNRPDPDATDLDPCRRRAGRTIPGVTGRGVVPHSYHGENRAGHPTRNRTNP
jgi:flagellar motor switch protein FliG